MIIKEQAFQLHEYQLSAFLPSYLTYEPLNNYNQKASHKNMKTQDSKTLKRIHNRMNTIQTSSIWFNYDLGIDRNGWKCMDDNWNRCRLGYKDMD